MSLEDIYNIQNQGGPGGGDRSGSRGRGEMEEDDDPVRRQWANHMLRNQVGP